MDIESMRQAREASLARLNEALFHKDFERELARGKPEKLKEVQAEYDALLKERDEVQAFYVPPAPAVPVDGPVESE